MPDKPLLSIVTPVYNGANFLEELIQSVRLQTYPNIEHIVIDDGSTDGGKTCEILARYPELKWWTHSNVGQAKTVNEGFQAATGSWVTTVSHDDYYSDRRSVERLMAHAESNSNADVVYGRTRFVYRDGTAHPIQPRQDYPFWMIPYHCFTFHCGLVAKTGLIRERELYFDPSYRFVSDDDWLKRLYLSGLQFSFLNSVVVCYRTHPDQVTREGERDADKAKLLEQECERVRETYATDPVLSEKARKILRFNRDIERLKAGLRGYYSKDGVWQRVRWPGVSYRKRM